MQARDIREIKQRFQASIPMKREQAKKIAFERKMSSVTKQIQHVIPSNMIRRTSTMPVTNQVLFNDWTADQEYESSRSDE